MTTLEKNMIRYGLFKKHIALAKGSDEDMRIASRLLHFLTKGEIRLGLRDDDMKVENILEEVGVRMRYSRNYLSAYAKM